MIEDVLPKGDPAIQSVLYSDGKYRLEASEYTRLLSMLPLMKGKKDRERTQLLLPPKSVRQCGRCRKDIESGEHKIVYDTVACDACFKAFQRWREIQALTKEVVRWAKKDDPKVEYIYPDRRHCAKCDGPYHSATGTVINPYKPIFLCGICSGRFYAWRLRQDGWRPINHRRAKRITEKLNKRKQKQQMMRQQWEYSRMMVNRILEPLCIWRDNVGDMLFSTSRNRYR